METQNAEVRNLLRETSEEKTISPGVTPFEELNDERVEWTAADIRLESDDAPRPAIAAKLASSTGYDPGARTREWMRKKIKLKPRLMVDYELADYSQDLATQMSARRLGVESPALGSVAFVLALIAVIGFLTAMLICGDRHLRLIACPRSRLTAVLLLCVYAPNPEAFRESHISVSIA